MGGSSSKGSDDISDWGFFDPTGMAPPPSSGGGGGGLWLGGEPHFRTWTSEFGGKRETFDGECDLVLVHSDNFHNGAGLDLHIRTTADEINGKAFSFVEAIALRIGPDILELDNLGDVYFNRDTVVYQDLPLTFGDAGFTYTVHAPFPVKKEDQENEELDMENYSKSQVYRIDLHDNGSHISLKTLGKFMSLVVYDAGMDFADSQGLAGDRSTGLKISRDGQIMDDVDTYGLNWQVQEDEAGLFLVNREPQLPHATCNMPSKTATQEVRRLRSLDRRLYTEAFEACSTRFPSALDQCIDDIMATGSMDVLDSWF